MKRVCCPGTRRLTISRWACGPGNQKHRREAPWPRSAWRRPVLRPWQRHPPAVLLVAHDVDEALVLADRVLVLAGGRITFGAPVDVPRDPYRDRDPPALIELRHKLLRQLGVSQEG